MVRETRFAFDDQKHPDDNPREHFSEEDERLLDGFSSPSESGNASNSAGVSRKRTPKRHPADGDWLDPQRNPAKGRRSVS